MDTIKEFRHRIIITSRERTEIEGVEHVSSFDEDEISLATKMGLLILKGEGLHIVSLNLDEGSLAVDGYITAVDYLEDKDGRGFKLKGKGLLDRILK